VKPVDYLPDDTWTMVTVNIVLKHTAYEEHMTVNINSSALLQNLGITNFVSFA
jgi:hypothetical protein